MSVAVRRALKFSGWLIFFGLSATLLAAVVDNLAPVIDSTPYPVAEVGQTYRYAVHATDPEGNEVSYSLAAGPAGMAWSDSDGAALYTPTAAQTGIAPVTVRARDSWGASVDQTYALRTVADFCEIYPITVPQSLVDNVRPGDEFTLLPRGTGPGNFSWLTWSGDTDAPTLAGSLTPPGNSYNYVNPSDPTDHLLEIGNWSQGATGSMNAYPVREQMDVLTTRDIVIPTWDAVREAGAGFDYRVARFATVRIRQYDLTGKGAISFEFRGYKNCYNDAPKVADLELATLEDTALPITLAGTDPENDVLIYTVLGAPAHGTLGGEGANLTYTPDADFFGDDTFTYRANDGEFESNLATVTIHIAPVNDAPVADDQNVATDEDVPVAILLTGGDPESDALSFALRTQPAHGALVGNGANWEYRPARDFFGEDSFTFATNDGELDSALATVRITVRERNAPPVASDLQFEAVAGVALDLVLAGSDPDGDALSYRLTSSPASGTLTGSAPNFAFTPDLSFQGAVTFGYLVNDGRLDSAVATVTIQVTSTNHPPAFTTFAPSFFDERTLFSYDANATDPDEGDVLSYQMQNAIAGTAVQSASGLLSWSPDASLVGGVRELNKGCRRPALTGALDPIQQWDLTTPTSFPTYDQTMSTPLVGQLSDDNGDGRVDEGDDPDVVMVAHKNVSGGYANWDSNLRSSVIRILDGKTGHEIRAIALNPSPDGFMTLALGDIDGDGDAEIVAPDSGGGVTVLRNDGSVLWRRSGLQLAAIVAGGTTIADLDADGTPEIIVGPYVLDHQGNLEWTMSGYQGRPFAKSPGVPSVVDLDDDGKLEVIAGAQAYRHDGSTLWQNTSIGEGLTGVGNVMGDARPEVAVVHDRGLYLLSATGERLWDAYLPGGGAGGAPTLADMDGDGELEIGVAGARNYTVFNADGSVLWTSPTQDRSSQITGSTVFDLDGDGEAEVFYNDEQNFRIYRGRDGKVLFQTLSTSGTHLEMPVVANIDDDPGAEIIVGSNEYVNFFNRRTNPATHGLRVFQSASGSWMPTRRIWNQHAYHIDNVNEDGTVPAQPQPSWKTHNTWRLNTFLDRNPAGMADLALFDLRLDPANPATLRLTARNRGLAPTSTATVVRVYSGNSSAGKLLGTWTLPALAAGEDRALMLGDVDLAALGDSLYAAIDEVDTVEECVENNNGIRATLFRLRATDRGGLYDQQVFSVGVLDVNDAPVFQAATLPIPRIGQKFLFNVQTIDADVGDGVTYRLENAPFGMSIEAVSGEVRWTPLANQAGVRTFTVRATDLRGASVSQTYSTTLAANRAPVIDSTPVTEAMAGQPYSYDVQAADPDDDLLSYLLVTPPDGMTIASGNGMITWIPTTAQAGNVEVTVRVIDPNGGAVTQTWTIAVGLPANHAPIFTSTPVTAIALGQRYQYDSLASDADDDVLSFSLLDAPLGMAVDTVTGMIVWQPRTDQVGAHVVRLQVSDPRGGTDTQEFTVLVSAGVDGGNHPPSVSSIPETAALIDQAYVYALVASDLDGDALSYTLQTAPSGMTIDVSTGAVTWTPTSTQAGLNAVSIVVSDGRGGTATQAFSILASTVPTGDTGNRPPSITSDPLTLVTLGQTYRYYLIAADADGDTLSYQLTEAPPGMTIDPSTGVLAWTPSALGPVSVSVRVDDGRGGAAMQSFTVTTLDTDTSIDHRPVVLEPPFGDAKVGLPYNLTLQAVDADGDAMTFALVSGPDGATVDAVTGQVSWTPSAVGTASFTVRISSGDGYTEITWTVQVAAAETPLSVHVVVTPERVAPGAAITIAVEFDGASGPVTLQASLNNNAVVLDTDGATSLVAPTAPGFYQLVVTVDDGNAIATDTADFFIADPSDTAPPSVAIATPAVDGRVTAPTSVTGKVLGDDVARWTLSLIDKSTGAMTAIAQGNQAIGPGVLGQLDPTLLSNGFYTLVLQAWDAGGNQALDSRSVLIEGDMKLGHYSVSFEDVSIPMAGFPLRVTRTYDTRRRKQHLDFGYGWSVDYQNLRLTESRAPGYSWTLVSEREGYFGNWCVRPNGDPIVAITGPDGELMKFRAKALPECQFLVPQTDVQLVFEPLPGTDAQLDQTDYQNLRLASVAGSGVYNLLDLADPYQAAANPSHYRLKLPDGTVYSLTQGVGISQIAEPDGNTLTFTRNGVKHSLGQEVRFFRDGQGRIEEVVLPDGARRRYTYTPAGDLEMAVDTGGDIVSFGYLAQAPHYLRDIVDPRGVRVSRNEYDDDGRLVATIDADGHRIEYTHNLAGRTEIIRDRRGNASVFAYDDEGRVTGESNALGETTLHSYDSNGNELSTTDPLGHVTVRTFDPRGNVLTETNPLGQRSTQTYNARNNPSTVTDALGRTTATNGYNAYTGRLVMTQDALGQLTSFGYDSGIGSGGTGELLDVTDAANQQTRYKINFFGHRYRETDALGNFTSFNLDIQGRVHGQSRRRTRADGTVETLATLYTLDAKDRIVATVHPDGSRTTVDYDGNDKPIKSCDALNRCTLQQYDARGQLAKTTYPDGTVEMTAYDENGNVTAQTDRGGRTTKLVYDAANRLVETLLPDATPGDDSDNPRTRSEYDAAGRMKASINERNVRTEYGYDAAGRRTTVTDALGHVTTTAFDAAGQRIAVTDALGRTTRFVYDLAGRLTQTVYPDDTAFEDDNPRTTIAYDAVGRKLAETDELGRQKAYGYDPVGRMVKVTLPNPATGQLDAGALVTRFVYDEAGNKTQQIDALGRVTRWEYDAMGRQTRRTLPGGQTETSSYDAAGQLRARTDFNGRTTRFSYDLAGRLSGVDYESDPDVITTYTASGQRESVTDGQGTTVYTYDARDRLTRVASPDGQVLTYGYDAAGNRTELHSAALDQTFDYDALNRLRAVHSQTLDGAVRAVRYTYDEVGNRKALTQANGTTTTTSFDARNRLRELLTRGAAGVLLFGATYDVDDSGARTGIGEFNAQGPTRSVGYAYDGVKRLLAEVIERPGQAARISSYVYDAVGNRLSKSDAGTLTTYQVDDNDRLITETTGGVSTLYTYDDNGNTVGQAKPGDVITYGYDEANRRVRATTTSGVVTTGYSADGIRNRESGNGHARSWLIDPNRDYAQTLEAYSDQQLSTVWVYGDELLAQSNVIDGGLHERNLHADGMGSVRQASDVVGSITDSFEYDAFGLQLSRTGNTDIDHRYRSEQIDSHTGFYNLRARWYDPTSGRFLSQDSWIGSSSDPISLHKYLYASSDPVGNIDPSGNVTLAQVFTVVNVAGNLQTAATIGINVLTGNYVSVAGMVAEEVVFSKLGAAGRPIGHLSKRAIGMFYRILGRTVKLRLSKIPNGYDLAHNLEQVGVVRPANTQAHHLVAGKSERAQAARDALERLDININSPTNGVFLPNRASAADLGTIHDGSHNYAYMDMVNERIIAAEAAGGKIGVLNELAAIKVELLAGLTELNRHGVR